MNIGNLGYISTDGYAVPDGYISTGGYVVSDDDREAIHAVSTVTRELSFTMQESSSLWDVLFGKPVEQPRYAVMLVRKISPIPDFPRKGRPLVGKRYRMARRKHVRQIRRWEKAGRPMIETHTYLPNVDIEVETP